MLHDKKGFGVLQIFLLVMAVVACLAVGLISFMRISATRDASYEPVEDWTTSAVDQTVKNEVRSTGCSSNNIIVMFTSGVSAERRQEIVTEQGLTVKNEFKTFSGYVLTAPDGKAQHFVDALRGYSEVQSANVDGCSSTNGAPNSTN